MSDEFTTHDCPTCGDVHFPQSARSGHVSTEWLAWQDNHPDADEATFAAGWNKAIAHATRVQTEFEKKRAHAVIGVFEDAEDDALADDIMEEVFAAMRIVETFTR